MDEDTDRICAKKRLILVKRYYKNFSGYNKETFKCTKLVKQNKSIFTKMSSKLECPDKTSKMHWSIINRFLNKRKIPNIPPLLVNRKLVSDFHKKAEIFN